MEVYFLQLILSPKVSIQGKWHHVRLSVCAVKVELPSAHDSTTLSRHLEVNNLAARA
jgi:hypothetical protein